MLESDSLVFCLNPNASLKSSQFEQLQVPFLTEFKNSSVNIDKIID